MNKEDMVKEMEAGNARLLYGSFGSSFTLVSGPKCDEKRLENQADFDASSSDPAERAWVRRIAEAHSANMDPEVRSRNQARAEKLVQDAAERGRDCNGNLPGHRSHSIE